MVADILTKPLTHEKHWKFSKAMGLRLHLSGSDKTGVRGSMSLRLTDASKYSE
ncbi:hypothetical protein SERLA73DRAFT_72698 [Serpula lacrymans var. lacrymans S7.3]|uniref:Uncharacterized protein n=1 Tax=Serpula lacrymans var. lacrymans (strain S7.3) TaxID=936435 RepID=F8PWC0_SERL3|nr:hypothetical protein SERLA73DRAFT_72698 [Serpula lacrymans var. lacrymans S7.3]